MEDVSIGKAIISYTASGEVIEAKFVSNLQITLDAENKLQLKGGSDEKSAIEDGNLLLAMWFNELTLIELVDRDKQQIVPTVKKCLKYLNGKIKECIIEYTLKPV